MTTREKIIDKAILLFIEKGFDNVTVDDICEATGITKPTFYYHLSSKDDIILQYYDYMINDLSPMLTKMLMIQNPHEQIEILFRFLLKGIKAISKPTNNQLYITNLKGNKGTFSLRDNVRQIGTSIIKRGQESGIFKSEKDPEKLLELSSHLFMGYQIMWCIEQRDDTWEDDFFEGLDMLLGYDG